MFNNNPYSVQFNSDPRSLHQRTNHSRFMSKNSNLSHPYIQAQQKKKCLNNQNKNNINNNQGISSSFSPNNSNNNNNHFNHNSLLNRNNNKSKHNPSRQNRKRKFAELFEEDEQGQYEYDKTVKILNPSSKQHISELDVMKSIRDDCLIDNDDEIDLNSIDHNFNKLSLSIICQSDNVSNLKNKRKRTLNDMIDYDYDDSNNKMYNGCKDKMEELCITPKHKKRRLSVNVTDLNKIKVIKDIDDEIVNKNINTDNDNVNIANDHSKITEQIRLELIPSIIQYAELINNAKDSFITKLSRSDSMLQRTRLNKHNGALVVYKKPSKSWRELIQNYYKNNKHSNVKVFTKMDDILKERDDDEINEDFEMGEHGEKRVKRKRPIRLHPSYTGFTKNGFMNSEELKQIANQCYVSTVNAAGNNNNNNKGNDDRMDCD